MNRSFKAIDSQNPAAFQEAQFGSLVTMETEQKIVVKESFIPEAGHPLVMSFCFRIYF